MVDSASPRGTRVDATGEEGEPVDTVRGDAGDDRIRARDGEPDIVSCGPGEDRADLDSVDVIADGEYYSENGSCEHVLRGPPEG